jgi:hypothetical protein
VCGEYCGAGKGSTTLRGKEEEEEEKSFRMKKLKEGGT